ncbi:hypothetical protein ARMGADRAFT_989161 [Armillaria gallica]|uniref:SAP domain-containing protein n=1 Tax=Armillaria gallica TaxID=47427 RepID=A0A2H3E1A6_ARMGA|nr:hypothetical protein ARMGADRAFT_989161 [Armillaria gallica]
MLSVSGRTAVRLLAQRRTFVSPAVLSQPWDTHSVSHLRQEARARGLSSRGNKSTLIARLQEHEKSLSSVAAAPNASTDEVPGIPSALESAVAAPPTGFWNSKYQTWRCLIQSLPSRSRTRLTFGNRRHRWQ